MGASGNASGNAALADRLESFAALLELADVQYHAIRAYRRAAEVIRSTPAPVAELVRAGRARELRGIGPGIEGRLRELIETGDIQELVELERELAPELIGLGRLLGIGAKRGVEIGRALRISTLDDFRAAAEEGRLQEVPGIGPQTEQKLLAALRASERPRPPRGLFEPVYGPGSASRFLALAPSRLVEIPNLTDDVDTLDDLDQLEPRVGPNTRAALESLRSGAR